MSFICLIVASCSKGDSDGGTNGGSDWYANKVINSFSLSYEADGYYKDYIIEHIDELFTGDGRYDGYINLPNGTMSHGPAGFNNVITVIHITNDNTLELYENCYLYKTLSIIND